MRTILILYEEESLKIVAKTNMKRATNFLLGLPNPKRGQRGGYLLLSDFQSRSEGSWFGELQVVRRAEDEKK
jgi:hypothetical protein